jgi:hypothetical protein
MCGLSHLPHGLQSLHARRRHGLPTKRLLHTQVPSRVHNTHAWSTPDWQNPMTSCNTNNIYNNTQKITSQSRKSLISYTNGGTLPPIRSNLECKQIDHNASLSRFPRNDGGYSIGGNERAMTFLFRTHTLFQWGGGGKEGPCRIQQVGIVVVCALAQYERTIFMI